MKTKIMKNTNSDAQTTVDSLNTTKSAKSVSFKEINSSYNKTNKEVSDILKDKLKLIIIILFYLIAIETFGGYISKSIMIFTDVTYLFSNLLKFIVTFFSLRSSCKKNKINFRKDEIFGTFFSVIFIWFISFYMLFIAFQRMFKILDGEHIEIDSFAMLISSFFGLGVNILMDYFLLEIQNDGNKNWEKKEIKNYEKKKICDDILPVEKTKKIQLKIIFEEDKENKSKIELKNSEISETESELDKELKIILENLNDNYNNNKKKLKDTLIMEEKKNTIVKKKKHNKKKNTKWIINLENLIKTFLIIITSSIIYINKDYIILDPIISIIFSIISFFLSIPITSKILSNIIFSPIDNLNKNLFREKLLDVKYVKEISDLSFKNVQFGNCVLNAHVICSDNPGFVLKRINSICEQNGIFETSIQIEIVKSDLVINNFSQKNF